MGLGIQPRELKIMLESTPRVRRLAVVDRQFKWNIMMISVKTMITILLLLLLLLLLIIIVKYTEYLRFDFVQPGKVEISRVARVCIYIYIYVCMYIYIYIERERDTYVYIYT